MDLLSTMSPRFLITVLSHSTIDSDGLGILQ